MSAAPTPAAEDALLAGWGNTAATRATVLHPTDADALAHALDRPAPRGIIARGLGRSYGDPAQNAGGLVVDVTGVTGIGPVDHERGVVTAVAGTSIDALITHLVPQGWFVPVTPGTRQVTVGGAIASDVHGKDHHAVGSWGSALESIVLVTPAGGLEQVSPTRRRDLFWATVGGMGLTGIIVEATFRLHRIESSLVSVDTDRTPDLDTTLDLMESGDHAYRYSVAWIDLMATGAHRGRSVLDRGRFATLDQLSRAQQDDPLAFHSGTLATFPGPTPVNLIRPLTVRAFNEVWYRKAPRRRRDHLQSISTFFHPLDMVDRWNRVYGRGGVVQWQCALPLGATDDLRWLVAQVSDAGCPSFLAVLKRFGAGNDAPLSFPIPGWTLAMDLPADPRSGAAALLDRLDERVVAAGGRLYLAKDSRMRPELLPEMYPRLDEWREVRDAADPTGQMVSDQARRLGLVG
ncbi:MAG: FAD-binding oxidoreductase [Actinobacteria bacterium]|nr:FAD-binding oxidoreductase [Actinomycetota bacterium]